MKQMATAAAPVTPPLKIGELAKQTGLSIRALHYYDEIGLLSPSHRTHAGHRSYTARDVARLQRITSLRELGFSLHQIRECIERPDFSARRIIELHIAQLEGRMEAERRLCARLRSIAKSLDAAGKVTVEQLIKTIEVTLTIGKYFTPEQQEQLKRHADTVGRQRIRTAEAEWKELMESVRREMDNGTDPHSKPVQALAKRWMQLVHEFTQGDAAIEASLKQMYRNEKQVAGMDVAPMREMFAYIQRALHK